MKNDGSLSIGIMNKRPAQLWDDDLYIDNESLHFLISWEVLSSPSLITSS
jgi:hypothetical protein